MTRYQKACRKLAKKCAQRARTLLKELKVRYQVVKLRDTTSEKVAGTFCPTHPSSLFSCVFQEDTEYWILLSSRQKIPPKKARLMTHLFSIITWWRDCRDDFIRFFLTNDLPDWVLDTKILKAQELVFLESDEEKAKELAEDLCSQILEGVNFQEAIAELSSHGRTLFTKLLAKELQENLRGLCSGSESSV